MWNLSFNAYKNTRKQPKTLKFQVVCALIAAGLRDPVLIYIKKQFTIQWRPSISWIQNKCYIHYRRKMSVNCKRYIDSEGQTETPMKKTLFIYTVVLNTIKRLSWRLITNHCFINIKNTKIK